jgi:hypothetical protein
MKTMAQAVRFLNGKFRFLENFKIIACRDSGVVRTAKTLQSSTPVVAVSE